MTPLAAVNENQVFQLQATSNGIRFDFSVIPFPSVPGVYTFVIELYDAASGAPWNLARSANLTFTLQNSPLPPANATMLGPHGNHFYVDSPALSQRGTWRVDAEVTPMSGAPLSARFYIVVG